MRLKTPRPDLVEIRAYFDALQQRVFTPDELSELFHENRARWKWSGSFSDFLDFMFINTPLHQLNLKSERRGSAWRYTWGEPRIYELALSLARRAYVSHGSALVLHGLASPSKTITINSEQSPKPEPPGPLVQRAIDAAFARSQRVSTNAYGFGDERFLILNGKHTGSFGVTVRQASDGSSIPTTSLERTLVDIVVRPEYAGGPDQILRAYINAKPLIDISALVETLQRLGHKYPYHQCVGLFLKLSGWDPALLWPLKELPLNYDFHVAHAVQAPEYDPEWRVYYPKHLHGTVA
jgi:hypothetical protein